LISNKHHRQLEVNFKRTYVPEKAKIPAVKSPPNCTKKMTSEKNMMIFTSQ